MFIGIDDTDSEQGLCTTYLAAIMMKRLSRVGEIRGFPRLVRLNPCVQFKTRGNAAVAFEFETDQSKRARELALQTFYEFSDLSGKNTNPGIVIAEDPSSTITEFYRKAATDILSINDALNILENENIWHRGLKNGRGLIGALAAVGAEFADFTHELIVYRQRTRWGMPREIDAKSVWQADALTYPQTWDNVDYFNNRIVFSPNSADPVLFGIRGEKIEAILKAFQIIKSEPAELKVLYKTNQGTDAHILEGKISGVEDDRSYKLCGTVQDKPWIIKGGHVFFSIHNGSKMVCSAFEPTKHFRNTVKKLIPGDFVEVYGAVRSGTLNLEKIQVLNLVEQVSYQAPICPSCRRRMESSGMNQGYRCRHCRTRIQARHHVKLQRDLEKGYYEVPPSARRHLSKPLVRMNGEIVHPSR
ncbi:MAG: tRNA(Ile)(2)-agmatinylcytidine synthase [Methanotrichaceae archaeon]|nr:tRNA(Ile)(2)-agmatinylcytidine synthase [Methanotrichaceae archaeon]